MGRQGIDLGSEPEEQIARLETHSLKGFDFEITGWTPREGESIYIRLRVHNVSEFAPRLPLMMAWTVAGEFANGRLCLDPITEGALPATRRPLALPPRPA